MQPAGIAKHEMRAPEHDLDARLVEKAVQGRLGNTGRERTRPTASQREGVSPPKIRVSVVAKLPIEVDPLSVAKRRLEFKPTPDWRTVEIPADQTLEVFVPPVRDFGVDEKLPRQPRVAVKRPRTEMLRERLADLQLKFEVQASQRH